MKSEILVSAAFLAASCIFSDQALAAGERSAGPGGLILLASLLIICGAVYFLPTIIALRRTHMSTGAVFVVNLFLGWTFLGWVAALAWAFTSNTRNNFRPLYSSASGDTDPLRLPPQS